LTGGRGGGMSALCLGGKEGGIWGKINRGHKDSKGPASWEGFDFIKCVQGYHLGTQINWPKPNGVPGRGKEDYSLSKRAGLRSEEEKSVYRRGVRHGPLGIVSRGVGQSSDP